MRGEKNYSIFCRLYCIISIYIEKRANPNYTAQKIFTKQTYLCNQHPNLETKH